MRGRRGVRRAYSVHHLPTVLNPKHNVIIRGKHPRRRASHSPAFEAIVHRRSRSARYSSAEYSGPQPAPFVRRSRIFAPRFAVAASVRTELKKYEGFANGDASRSRARILSIVRGRLDSRRASADAPRGAGLLTWGRAQDRLATWRRVGSGYAAPRHPVPPLKLDPAHPLLRRGIGKVPGHELLEGLRDFVEGVDIGVEPEGIGSVRAGLHLRRVEERQKRRLPGLPISDDYDVRHGLPVRGAPRRGVVPILWKSLLEPSNRDRSGEGSGLVALRPKGFVTEFLPGDVRINVTLKRQVFSSARAIRVPR